MHEHEVHTYLVEDAPVKVVVDVAVVVEEGTVIVSVVTPDVTVDSVEVEVVVVVLVAVAITKIKPSS